MIDYATTERNRRYLVVEIVWAAIFTGCVSFNAAYLIRLGGSNLLVSLMSSGAALVNVCVTLLCARFLERRTERKPWIVGSLALVRLGHIGLIVVPWLPAYRPEFVVGLLMLLTVPAALFAAGWVPMLADVVPLEKRARVFGTRNMLMGAGTMATTFTLGLWLRWAPFPLNYQLLYTLAVITSMVSTWYVTRIVMPPSTIAINAARVSWASTRQAMREQRPFVNIVVNTLIFNLPVWMATPLQPIYFVRTLGASDAWLGFWIGLVSGGAIIGNLVWSRAIERQGAGWVLPRAAVLSAAFYLLCGLFPNLNLILVFAVLAGCINAGVDVSHLSTLLQVCPAQRRAMYVGIFVTVMNLGFFVVPLWVAPITSVIGARNLMLVLGGMRLVGGLLFTVNPVRAALPQRGGIAVGGH